MPTPHRFEPQISFFYHKRGETSSPEAAEPLLLAAFHGREAKLGPEHPRTLDSLRELVTLYESWPRPNEAAKWRARLAQRVEAEE